MNENIWTGAARATGSGLRVPLKQNGWQPLLYSMHFLLMSLWFIYRRRSGRKLLTGKDTRNTKLSRYPLAPNIKGGVIRKGLKFCLKSRNWRGVDNRWVNVQQMVWRSKHFKITAISCWNCISLRYVVFFNFLICKWKGWCSTFQNYCN